MKRIDAHQHFWKFDSVRDNWITLGTMEFAGIAGAKVIALDINEQRLQFCKGKLKVTYTVNALASDVTEQLKEITNGDMPTVVIDAIGSLKAINNAFQYMAHGARYVLIDLQKGDISFELPRKTIHTGEGCKAEIK